MAVHNLKPGQILGVNWRQAEGLVREYIDKLRLNPLTNGLSGEVSVYATFVDARGVSVYILRGPERGGDIEAFLPAGVVMWQRYFVAYNQFAPGYVRGRHYTGIFPRDFV